MKRFIEDLVSLFVLNMVNVQLSRRHLTDPNDPTCYLDHSLQFGLILNTHVSNGADQAEGQNTSLGDGTIDYKISIDGNTRI